MTNNLYLDCREHGDRVLIVGRNYNPQSEYYIAIAETEDTIDQKSMAFNEEDVDTLIRQLIDISEDIKKERA